MKINFALSRNTIILLCLLFILGIVLRFFELSSFPNGFSRDEAFLGYNAYSILVTGKDINGHFLPLFLESFLYTPAGYSYISVPFIKIFGLSIFSVRFASAFFGALSIPALFFLTKSLLALDKEKKYSQKTVEIISLVAALFITISPWHINLSRTASVSTVVTFFIVLGCYFFTRWLLFKKNIYIIFTFVSYLLSLFFYIAPFSFLPFFILLSYFLFKGAIPKANKKIFFILLVVFLVPVIYVFSSQNLSLRIRSLSLTESPLVKLVLTEDTARDGVGNIMPIVARSFHNKVTVISDMFAQNYFSHFSYNFLFRDSGFPERFKIPGSGLLLPINLLFIALGIFYLFRSEGKLRWLLIGWVLLGPVGSGFASDDVPNLQRTLFMLPPIFVVSSIGIVNFYLQFSKRRFIGSIVGIILLSIFMYQFIYYIHQYYFHENAYRPWYRQDGYQQLIEKINRLKGGYSNIVITNRESAPTIFLLFFNKFDPASMQATIKKSELRDTDRISFSNYEITQEECPLKVEVDLATGIKTLVGEKGVLYVNSGFCNNEDLPPSVKVLDTVLRGDGSKVFFIMSID